MAQKALVPSKLTRRPFTVADAKEAGLQRWHLEGSSWRRIRRGTYVSSTLAETPLQRLQTALRRLPPGTVFSVRTAAWLHGIDVEPCDPIEVTVPAGSGVSARAGMAVRRSILAKSECAVKRDMPVTSIERTLTELCDGMDLVEAVVILDAALHTRLVALRRLSSWVEAQGGRRGIRAIRRAMVHAEPATESQMESRLRMLLVLGGLPRPKAQVSIRDSWGRLLGRPDLYYEDKRLAIEYDGGIHRDTMVEDNRRQNRLTSAGVRLLRFTAGDVWNSPERVVAEVRAMLQSSGC